MNDLQLLSRATDNSKRRGNPQKTVERNPVDVHVVHYGSLRHVPK